MAIVGIGFRRGKHRREARQALLEAELRLASLRKVLERRRAEVALQQQRREQKQTDERAALRAGRGARSPQDQEY